MSQYLRTRIFVRPRGGELVASELRVELPTRFLGFPGKPLAADHPPVYQAIAFLPGVLPDEGFSFRSWSDLEALINVLASAKRFCKDFVKSGGSLFMAMSDNEDVPNLEMELSIKNFFGS